MEKNKKLEISEQPDETSVVAVEETAESLHGENLNDRVRVLSHGTINDFRNGLASSDHFPVTAEIVLLDSPEK